MLRKHTHLFKYKIQGLRICPCAVGQVRGFNIHRSNKTIEDFSHKHEDVGEKNANITKFEVKFHVSIR